jgi:hypothetical protein
MNIRLKDKNQCKYKNIRIMNIKKIQSKMKLTEDKDCSVQQQIPQIQKHSF